MQVRSLSTCQFSMTLMPEFSDEDCSTVWDGPRASSFMHGDVIPVYMSLAIDPTRKSTDPSSICSKVH